MTPEEATSQTSVDGSGDRRWPLIAQVLLLAGAYWGAGRLALLMAIAPGYATAVWPSAGIALVAVLIWGARVWPGIVLGSFLVNVATAFDSSTSDIVRALLLATLIGVGAALQAVAGGFLIRRFVGYPTALDRERHVVLFLALGGPLSCLVNAIWAVLVLAYFRVLPEQDIMFTAWTWWVGDAIGVVIFTPLILTFIGQPRLSWKRRRANLALALSIGFAVVTTFFVRASEWEQAQHDSEYAQHAESLANAVQGRLDQYAEVVESLASLLSSVNSDAVKSFTRAPLARHRGMQALSWHPRVSAAEREAYENAARLAGRPSFELKERGEAGQWGRAALREVYFPADSVEPLVDNEWLLGFDLGSAPRFRETLSRAASERRIQTTTPMKWSIDEQNLTGFFMVVPVFASPQPGPSGSKVETLRGFAACLVRADGLMEEALRGLNTKGLSVRLVDESRPGSEGVLYDNAVSPPRSHRRPALGWTATLHVAARSLSLTFFPTEAIAVAQRSWQAWTVLAAGLFFVGLLGAVLLIVTGREARVAEAAVRVRQSQMRTEAIFNSALDAIVSMDHLGNVLEFNTAAEKLLGYSRDEVFGRPMADLIIPPSLRQLYRDALARYLATGQSSLLGKRAEVTAMCANGREVPIELAILEVPSSRPPLFVGFMRDLTEQKRSAEALELANARSRQLEAETEKAKLERKADEQFRTLLEAAPDAMVVVDDAGNIVVVNAQTETMFGYLRSELLGTSVDALVPGLREGLVEEQGRAMGSGSELVGIRKDGSRFPAEVSLSPFKSEQGVLVVSAIRDVTERSRAEAIERELMNEQTARNIAETAVEVRDDFVATAGHELKTPLAATLMHLQSLHRALKRGTLVNLEERLEKAIRSSLRLDKLVNQLLDVSRISANRLHPELEPFNFLELVREVVARFEEASPDGSSEITVSHEVAEKFDGFWDRARVDQVVNNVLSNAIKYGRGKPVEVDVKVESGFVVLRVTDHGIGIDPERQKKIFERFERAVATREFGGFGLGLWISRQIVELSGGRIEVQSELNRGSTFIIYLPLKLEEQTHVSSEPSSGG